MENSKHTKENWKSTDGYSSHQIYGMSLVEISTNDEWIALVRGNSEAEAAERAKIIAAAPELLQTLIDINNIENAAFGLKGFDIKRLKEKINAAIEKATK